MHRCGRLDRVTGEVREAIFGMQDGLLTSVGLVSAVGSAVTDSWFVLLAGFASALAGSVSMAVGEYVSSRSQREIYEAEIADERSEVAERPAEARAEVSALWCGGTHDVKRAVRLTQVHITIAARHGGKGAPLQPILSNTCEYAGNVDRLDDDLYIHM